MGRVAAVFNGSSADAAGGASCSDGVIKIVVHARNQHCRSVGCSAAPLARGIGCVEWVKAGDALHKRQ